VESGIAPTALSRDSFQRFAREITYRVRNPGCEGVGVGSAFALDARTLVTNQHVVDGGLFQLELSTWDGREVEVDVSNVSTWADIAVIRTKQDLPVIAPIGSDPIPDQEVAAVGYPLGGRWTLTSGRIVDVLDGGTYGVAHPVLRFDAEVRPGNSGGPLLDTEGNVVGVVFALELEGRRLSLAIPVSVLESQVSSPLAPNAPAC
jgi:S1-C subfamily serine protease